MCLINVLVTFWFPWFQHKSQRAIDIKTALISCVRRIKDCKQHLWVASQGEAGQRSGPRSDRGPCVPENKDRQWAQEALTAGEANAWVLDDLCWVSSCCDNRETTDQIRGFQKSTKTVFIMKLSVKLTRSCMHTQACVNFFYLFIHLLILLTAVQRGGGGARAYLSMHRSSGRKSPVMQKKNSNF